MLGLRRTQQPLQSLSHQFLQRCSVSGTSKGKGKDGVAKKRSKVTTNKKKSGSQDPSKPLSRQDSERHRLYDQCINAPTPVRYLKPKDRPREAEREKMGLLCKDRIREKEILKKGGRQAMGVPDEPMIIGTPGLDLISLGLVDVDKIPKYELTEEDGMKLAKEYSRVLMRKHRARQAALSNFLRCKNEAIEALPDNLKMAALIPDSTPFPAGSFMATLTPPIEGYSDKINEAAKMSAGMQKIR
ncbi:39S RIBOSOMAL PROTEIN L40 MITOCHONDRIAL [Salix viminalis]|uniref:39S RIBOSOMAL PROTEIN L40 MITOCHONDRIAL n=1 Tax=Salix viminalis TaxID=40686 RepID=A0A9Q0U749_SALVM|nr:39S RIBOSOMAL PROTEIN L40 MITOCHONDRIAL [Salix viminalis]